MIPATAAESTVEGIGLAENKRSVSSGRIGYGFEYPGFEEQCVQLPTNISRGEACQQPFLGPHVGFAHVFKLSDEDGSCYLDLNELALVCAVFYEECVSFLRLPSSVPAAETSPCQPFPCFL